MNTIKYYSFDPKTFLKQKRSKIVEENYRILLKRFLYNSP